jgi:DNA-directed RNA polymerase subunit L
MSKKNKTKQTQTLQIKITKDKENELEIEFSDRLFKKVDVENVRILTDDGWTQSDKKDIFYKDISNKELPEVLRLELIKNGVDAYTYESHPLIPGYRLNVSGKNPKKEIKNALKNVEKEWNELRSLLEKKLK